MQRVARSSVNRYSVGICTIILRLPATRRGNLLRRFLRLSCAAFRNPCRRPIRRTFGRIDVMPQGHAWRVAEPLRDRCQREILREIGFATRPERVPQPRPRTDACAADDLLEGGSLGDTEFALRDRVRCIVADAYTRHLPQKWVHHFGHRLPLLWDPRPVPWVLRKNGRNARWPGHMQPSLLLLRTWTEGHPGCGGANRAHARFATSVFYAAVNTASGSTSGGDPPRLTQTSTN